MVAHVLTVAFQGIEALLVDVQVHIHKGPSAFQIVGLPDKIVGESKERIRAALSSIGIALPAARITVNLSPAHILKEGSHFDLPILLGILVACDVIHQDLLENYVVMGEVSLGGDLLAVPGVLPAAVMAYSSRKGVICPWKNMKEAAWSDNDDLLGPTHVSDVVHYFNDHKSIATRQDLTYENKDAPDIKNTPDLQDIRGQETAKRVLEIVASGGHHLLMVGPPGVGKSLLASCLPGLLPTLEHQEILELEMIRSVAGHGLKKDRFSTRRPFRAPHHSASMASIIGGGAKAYPGEISFAHKGVLFLDELPEFERRVLDALRQPLETKSVSIARVQAHISYPADFQLVAAMNPCKCGYFGDQERMCHKAPACALDYQAKISGPILDRFDCFVDLPHVSPLDLMTREKGEASKVVAERVKRVRHIQKMRYQNLGFPYMVNGTASHDVVEQVVVLSDRGQDILKKAVEKFKLSVRSYYRLLRLARTIADMSEEEHVQDRHITEALSYRRWLSD